MTLPPLEELLKSTRRIVIAAVKADALHTLTPKSVRQKVEEEFQLAVGTLDEAQYKGPIKEAIQKAMASSGSEDERTSPVASKGKGKSVDEVLKTKRKSEVGQNNDEPGEVDKPKKRSRVSEAKDSVSPIKRKAKSPPPSGKDKDEQPKASTSRRKSSPLKRTAVSKRKVVISSDEGGGESEASGDEFAESADEVAHPKKAKSKKESVKLDSKPASKITAKASRKTSQQFKSREHVPTSDMSELDEPQDVKPKASPIKVKSPSKKAPAHLAVPLKRKKAIVADSGSEEGEEKKPAVRDTTPKSTAKPAHKTPIIPQKKPKVEESDSELSVLIDEPPKKAKKKPRTSSEPKEKPPTKKRSASASKDSGLSKEEETIKRLKSYVVACGVRKQWKTLFAGLSDREQISRLKQMLSDLGMTGKLSMDRAKAIKTKREFEQELQDVQEFAKKMERRESFSKNPQESVNESDIDDEESEEEADQASRKRARNARNSIAAFLQDQSDSE